MPVMQVHKIGTPAEPDLSQSHLGRRPAEESEAEMIVAPILAGVILIRLPWRPKIRGQSNKVTRSPEIGETPATRRLLFGKDPGSSAIARFCNVASSACG
jgi:hypothetical protein